MGKFISVLLLLTMMSVCSSFRILVLLPFPMKSHHLFMNPLLAKLVDKGHDVTVYGTHPLQTNSTSYKYVSVINSLYNAIDKKYSFDKIKPRLNMEAFMMPNNFHLTARNMSDETLNHPEIIKLLGSNEEFDIVIIETFFSQEALIGFGYRFNAPVVTVASFGSFAVMDSSLGNPNPLPYFSTYLLPFTSDMTFYQRFKNFIASLYEHYSSYYYHLPYQEEVMRKHLQKHVKTRLPPITELLNNISVVLLNTQPEISYARPWVPNMVPVGGLHIATERTSLPKDIKDFIDDAKEGFIYVSFGSTFSTASFPDFLMEALISAFKRIPLQVIWKADVAPAGLPQNVKTLPWAPQIDILADVKCRGFITHGGILSLLEAVHFEVPLIGVPLFGDQPWNVAKIAHAEIGVQLKVLDITPETMLWSINQVVYNKTYKRNMQQLSAQMKDKPLPPLDTAVYWVEYVGRHQGAPLLQSPARHLPLAVNLFIDVFLALIVLAAIVITFLYVLSMKMCRLFLLLVKKNKDKKE